MSNLYIPVEVRLVTLTITTYRLVQRSVQVGRTSRTQTERVADVQRVESGQDEAGVRNDFQRVNQIWAPAEIVFQVRRISGLEEEAPERAQAPGMQVDRGALERSALNTLLARFRGQSGSSVVYVNRFAETTLGGVTGWRREDSGSVTPLFSSVIPHLSPTSSAEVLAHELGHQLSLPDIMPAGMSGHDGQTPLVANSASGLDSYNVMWGGLRAGSRLTRDQIARARSSDLVKKFGTTASAP